MRPARLTPVVAALVAVGLALLGVAKTTGSGWLVVMLCVVGGIVVVGALVPAAVVARVTVEVAGVSRDATAGQPAPLTVRVARAPAAVVRVVQPAGSAVTALGTGSGEVFCTPGARGVLREVEVVVESAWPLGLVWWTRRRRVALPREMLVGPAPIPVTGEPPVASLWGGDLGLPRSAADGDVPRSVRDYRPGDPLKLVHWRSTARAGKLVVKELESPEPPAVAFAVDVTGPGGEHAARWTAGAAASALGAGMRVVLLTHEPSGPVSGAVASPVEVSRRLARCTPGSPSTAVPAGVPVVPVGSGR